MILVVLPFESLGGGDKYDYFSEGLTEDMITQLARLSPERLGVIARTSAMRYKSTTKTIHQIGQDLGVSHVLEEASGVPEIGYGLRRSSSGSATKRTFGPRPTRGTGMTSWHSRLRWPRQLPAKLRSS